VESTGGVVAEGRDITTVVAPDADVRILLMASEEARSARRNQEIHGESGESGESAVNATRDQIVRRDKDDSTVSQFMQAAPGVMLLDNSDLDLRQSIAAVLELIRVQTGREDEQPAGSA
ncbi:MAG TPA: (d)CMP kinase, partial [Dermatophilaceae bacterium]|nr:(d)CMP kinase [Dermatophilaceae bacterium]